MAKILVAYFSKGGNVKKMAEFVAKGVKEEGVEVTVKTVESVLPDDLINTMDLFLARRHITARWLTLSKNF